jgi:glutathione S-transferase
MISISAMRWVPEFAQGYVKDLRVRWALEEAGLPYAVRLQTQADRAMAEYRTWQPFGQVPAFEEDGLRLFESGAIVLHIGARSEALLPTDAHARAKAVQWLVAALNSIEPFTAHLAAIDGPFRDETWAQLRRQSLSETVRHRLDALSQALGDKTFLDGDRFTAGDLVMTTVLRDLDNNELLTGNECLAAYVARCMARPAFERAHAAQIADFNEAA